MHGFVYMFCKPRGKYFPFIKQKKGLFYMTLFNLPFLASLTSKNDVICTITNVQILAHHGAL